MTSDYQWVVSRVEWWTNRGVSYCVVQPYLSACGALVRSTGTMVDNEGEGNAGLCRWTGSSEG
jgi:hypothetical protein